MTCREASELAAAMAAMTDEELAAAGKMTRAQRDLAARNRGLAGTAAKEVVTDLMDFEERVSVGYWGVCRAAMRYRPERGVRFSTYATWAAKFSILNEIKRLEREKNVAHRDSLCDPLEMAAYVEDRPHAAPEPDLPQQVARVEAAMGRLTARERAIVRRRAGEDSLSAIGRDWGITKERVRQIDVKARRAICAMIRGDA